MRAFSKRVHDVSQLNDFLVTSQLHPDKQYLVQILSTQSRECAVALAKAVLSMLPNAHVIGHSTRNVILDGDIFTSGCLINLIEFGQTTLTSAVQAYSFSPDIDGGELKRSLQLQSNSQVIISFAVQIERRDYPLYQTFATENVRVSGGLAQTIEDGCWVLYQNQTYDNAVVAVALHSDTLKTWTDAYSEWNPIGMPHKVTHAKGTRLYCLGERKALDVYKHYLADGHDVTINQLLSFPLYRETLGRKEVCTVTELHADGSMSFDRPWCLGDEVQFCYNHPSLTLEQVRHGVVELAMHQPEVVMIYNCASRLDFIDSSDEVQAFMDIAATFGSYCMGEIHGDIGQPEILHHSLTYLAMREGDEVQSLNLPKPQVSASISPLFSLIRNAIGDLNHMNAHMGYQLDRQTRKLQESYRRDSRTGLQNRVALQERLSHIDCDEHLLTLKLLNFSHINEKYGYRVGDQLLKDLSMHFTNRLRKRLGMPAALQLYSIGVGEWAFVFKAEQSSETIKQHFTRFADAVEQTNFEPLGLREIDYLSISLCGGLVSRRDFPSASPDELLLKGIEARRSGVRSNTHMIRSTLHYMRDKKGDFSINLSPQDLLSDKTLMLLEHEISQLNDSTRIGLEVLESEQIKDYGRMIEVCSHFRKLGARIIVDDFGSGYSNIDEILKLEPEVIKLDGSLIRDIDKDLKQRKIASQLVRLCQVFNAETVAEFVHNREVCKIAQDMGVDYLQGYYLGEPTRLF
ncbi:sensor domain-containing phosphodiesterase [Vibrio parahaemolyticus]|uniref:EAL domain-containing protein n=1 Tax=Vibrio parahaemolyticus TaxID=670 RepID=UPI00111E8DAA|nr:EAL domain-containing protein [Vibrio parahaemolyticus]TOF21395.1 sensor domain-containing phosphodiesterase [Vibrio parahaemolyticus]